MLRPKVDVWTGQYSIVGRNVKISLEANCRISRYLSYGVNTQNNLEANTHFLDEVPQINLEVKRRVLDEVPKLTWRPKVES